MPYTDTPHNNNSNNPKNISLPYLSPEQVLLRLNAAGLSGVVLLESAGPVLPYSRYSFLSAQPERVCHSLPTVPESGAGFFPAWIGGLKYEAAAEYGLSVHSQPSSSSANKEFSQWWGFYPSGLVWDRQQQTLQVIGQPHLAWQKLLLGPMLAALPELRVSGFGPDDLDYTSGVLQVQELIRAGEVYQVNLSRGVQAEAIGQPLAAYLRLRELNPSPFMVYAALDGETVVSCSPERLITWQGNQISARPIAGTRRRGETPAEDAALEQELRNSSKEVAEHTMLVDLVRHDLGAVAAAGSVHVPDLMLVERYSHVMHLVSEVRATVREGITLHDVLAANFPGGTITGAPKARVMDAIAELEVAPRGWYTGSFGIVATGHIDLNILIRTADFRLTPPAGLNNTSFEQLQNIQGKPSRNSQKSQARSWHWQVTVRAGGGTVIDADPKHEAQETIHKAQVLLSALSEEQAQEGRSAQAPATPTQGRPWQPPAAPDKWAARVLLLDNRDSFTWNIAHDLLSLGAILDMRSQNDNLTEILASQPQAILIGPGPGRPETSGVTLELTRAALAAGIPLLGVCLGHQALGQVLGGSIERARPVHGRPEQVKHASKGLFAGIPSGSPFGRYHSLVVRDLEIELITAGSKDGEVMALEVPYLPAWGVQFHPESVLSPYGRVLLGNWLRLALENHS